MQVRTVLVIGTGTMGAGIAQACAQAGFETIAYDAQPGAAEAAIARVHGFWAKGVTKGKVTAQDEAVWKSRLHPASDLAASARRADLCIEAVPESLDLKQKVFRELDGAAPAHAVLATNTSSLSIDAIASATTRPASVVGMHFFNPVPLMQLLEVVRHDRCSPEAVATAQAVAAAMGKTSIVVRDSPGFATSRLGIVLGNEAMRMLEEGVASAKDIDTAMRLGYGHPMGPLELSDLVGLDVRLAIGDYLHKTLGGDHYRSPALVRSMVDAGHLGRKSGKGFYDWTDGTPKERPLP